jgi:hypothetical protein
MTDKQNEPKDEEKAIAGHNAHPAEPPEGAPQPGESTKAATPPHPDEPAEGER